MTQTKMERRLAVAERQLSELRIEVAKLNVLVGVLLQADAPQAADTERLAEAVGVIRPADRPRLRLVDGTASVSGDDLEEGLRRVRTGHGEGR
ncbi:hypothetical protein QNO09_34355 [Streptomyces sp. 378]|uniref:hypothetical protein n=1 Tax=Streptomyces sp. 378 TaxID=3049412 RepID=UPI0024C3EADE|nr:hypothetical protein [Streptomyces sp. 378]MDK1348273.1 hypothetical protein [Streptomyces sp. 378]